VNFTSWDGFMLKVVISAPLNASGQPVTGCLEIDSGVSWCI
jgi:hypothetical protein